MSICTICGHRPHTCVESPSQAMLVCPAYHGTMRCHLPVGHERSHSDGVHNWDGGEYDPRREKQANVERAALPPASPAEPSAETGARAALYKRHGELAVKRFTSAGMTDEERAELEELRADIDRQETRFASPREPSPPSAFVEAADALRLYAEENAKVPYDIRAAYDRARSALPPEPPVRCDATGAAGLLRCDLPAGHGSDHRFGTFTAAEKKE